MMCRFAGMLKQHFYLPDTYATYAFRKKSVEYKGRIECLNYLVLINNSFFYYFKYMNYVKGVMEYGQCASCYTCIIYKSLCVISWSLSLWRKSRSLGVVHGSLCWSSNRLWTKRNSLWQCTVGRQLRSYYLNNTNRKLYITTSVSSITTYIFLVFQNRCRS